VTIFNQIIAYFVQVYLHNCLIHKLHNIKKSKNLRMSYEIYKISSRVEILALFDNYLPQNDTNLCFKIIINQFNYRILYALIKFTQQYTLFRRNFLKFLLHGSENELRLFFSKYDLNYSVLINYKNNLRVCLIADSLIIKDVIIRVW
jgi:hypothetical protein